MPVHRFALRKIMARDPTVRYFAGTDRDRAAFEAGIKLGSILHQYVGVPLTRKNAASLERAIEAATRVQPLVEDVKVRIDRKRLRLRGPYRYDSHGGPVARRCDRAGRPIEGRRHAALRPETRLSAHVSERHSLGPSRGTVHPKHDIRAVARRRPWRAFWSSRRP